MSIELEQRYAELAHAVQTFVLQDMVSGDDAGATPKHLRTGLNLRACDHTALVRLLIARGLFTQDEYEQSLVDELEREVARYERILSERTGFNVRLG